MNKQRLILILTVVSAALVWLAWGPATAATGTHAALDLTRHWAGYLSIALFAAAYVLVIGEEALHLRKSKPVMFAAGLIWVLVALAYNAAGDNHAAEIAVRHNLLEFAELFLFLLAAMTYINTMDERGVFDVLRTWLVTRGFSFRGLFWVTGGIAFVLSPIADNLTTALLLSTVIMAIGGSNPRFAAVACINVVVAANAGGAFSPFGDITTLMVWQKGVIQFTEFFVLFVPSLVNWVIPAVIMSFTVPTDRPARLNEKAELQHGAMVVVGLFILTIVMAVSAHNFLHLPPVLGMMTGLGVLKLYGYRLKRRHGFAPPAEDDLGEGGLELEGASDQPGAAARPSTQPFDVFKALERAEWDTLMFFYGIILCVGGLGAFGYLALGSELMYGDLGPTTANVLVGILSAVIDNIPIMFAVLSVLPEMNHGQWLLVTLTAGVVSTLPLMATRPASISRSTSATVR